MEARPPRAATTTTFAELPVDLSIPAGGSLVHIQLPTTGAFGRTSRATRQVSSDYSDDDKAKWSSTHPQPSCPPAEASGICFRAASKYPRSILWRTIGAGQTLELRSVDLYKDGAEHKEASVVLQLTFPQPLRKNCIGLADAERGDAVIVSALAGNNDFYTLTCPSTFFCGANASEEEPEQWCQTTRVAALASGNVFKLTYCAANSLVFALGDGRLVQLSRQAGTAWSETVFGGDGQWGDSFRGLLGWQGQNKVYYNKQNLDYNTALAAVPSPDGKHLISVTLNHAMRVWSSSEQKLTLSRDLLQQDAGGPAVLFDPGLRRALALEAGLRIAFAGDGYYLFTYSPHDGGVFKVWGVRDADFGTDGVRDLFAEHVLSVPDPDDGALWTLADFGVDSNPSTDQLSIWVMLRLNKRYQLFCRKFSGLRSVGVEWADGWERVAIAPHKALHASEPLGLAVDISGGLPWLLGSTSVSPIRTCTETEAFVYNGQKEAPSIARSIEGGGPAPLLAEAAAIIDAAAHFCAGLDSLIVNDAIRLELWQEPAVGVPTRLVNFYNEAGLGEAPDRDYDELFGFIDRLGGPTALTDDLFVSVLDTFPSEVSQGSRLASTAFGRKAIAAGATELISIQEKLIQNLLCAVVFIDQESESSNVDAPRVFEQLTAQLRVLEVLRWIADKETIKGGRPISVLEDLFGSDIRPQALAHQSGSAALSGTIRDLLKWATGGNNASISIDHVIVNIECSLLVNEDVVLASGFLKFLPTTAWATYVRGRYNLLLGDFASAAVLFAQSAYQLSRPHPPASFYGQASAGLVDAVEVGYFAAGLANFYTHITRLVAASPAHVAQFAALALQHWTDGSAAQRSDLLARLFTSSLSLHDYDAAFAALTRYTDYGLRRAALRGLVTEMLRDGAAAQLIALPFSPALRAEIDNLLGAMVRDESGSDASTRVLYAWRIRQGDYRGAAACLAERLYARKPGRRHARTRHGVAQDKKTTLDDYLVAINALSLVGGQPGVGPADSEGWVFVGGNKNDKSGSGPGLSSSSSSIKPRRKLVRLRDLRRDYQTELDNQDRWARGRFALTAATAGDDDDDEDDEDEESGSNDDGHDKEHQQAGADAMQI